MQHNQLQKSQNNQSEINYIQGTFQWGKGLQILSFIQKITILAIYLCTILAQHSYRFVNVCTQMITYASSHSGMFSTQKQSILKRAHSELKYKHLCFQQIRHKRKNYINMQNILKDSMGVSNFQTGFTKFLGIYIPLHLPPKIH